MTTLIKSSMAVVLAMLVLFCGKTMAGNCPDGTVLSVSVTGTYYVDIGASATYSCSIDSGTSGGTYIWKINDVTASETGSSLSLTGGSAGTKTIYCTYTSPGGGCYASDSISVTVLQVDGLVAYYPFCGNASDVSGNGYNGTVSGAVLMANRMNESSSAYFFDGVNDRISLPSGVMNFERTDSYTESFWMKTDDTDYANQMLAKMNSSVDSRGILVAVSEGLIRAHVISCGPSNKINVTGTSSVNDNQWHHIVVTYDGSSTAAGLAIYVDGIPEVVTIGKDALSGTILNTATPSIGARNYTYHYEGALDDVRIYNRVLDGSEITELYNNTVDTDDDGIPDWWEIQYGFAIYDVSDASADADSDGLSNLEEFERSTDPTTSTLNGVLITIPDDGTYRIAEPDLELNTY